MQIPNLRSSYEKVGEIVFFGRMLDKIRLRGFSDRNDILTFFDFHDADEGKS